MTKKKSVFFRFLLFLAGAGIIILAFFLTRGEREFTGIEAFVWSSIGLMYLVFFLPFFFSAISIEKFSGKIPVLSMVWLGILLYLAASVIVIALLSFVQLISLNAAIIIQSILLFLFLVDVYFAYFASSHIGRVAAEEAGKQQYLNHIKSRSQVLSLSINKLPAEFENVQKIIKQTLDDIKFIYPVSGGAGNGLETRIIKSLLVISELCGNISSGAYPASLAPEAENLRVLVKERKMLRN